MLRSRCVHCIVAICAMVLTFASTCLAADPLPTPEEIHAAFDQQQYSQVLQKLQRVLLLKGAAAAPYDRHDLLRLKGETHLRMKAAQPAVQAFDDAAGETSDLKQAAVDRATAVLIKRSPALHYLPKVKEKGKPVEPIDIVDAEGRKKGLTALFEDELALAEPKVKAVRDARQLGPILAVIPTIRDVRLLELASGGTENKTKKLASEVAAHARDLMADGVKIMTKTTDDIDKTANEYVMVQDITRDPNSPTGVRTETRWKKRGLNQRDSGSITDVAQNCAKIIPATRELADAIGEGSVDFAGVRADADKLGRRAEQILQADYSRTYSRPPR